VPGSVQSATTKDSDLIIGRSLRDRGAASRLFTTR
jgi:hypothetical protein